MTKMDAGESWLDLAAKKRASLGNSIPLEWQIPADLVPPETQDDVTTFPAASGWFTDNELAITGLSAVELLAKLASGSLTSVAVTSAFCKRAAAAHQLTNCLSEIFFDKALETARRLDEHFAQTGKPLGPLHGLPISLKDCFNLVGIDSTVGLTASIGKPATEDAAIAKLLRSLGAVFYVKTNVPTSMMIAETVNNIFGRTLNPKNRRLTCGGSSGGEAALILFGGSMLGVGTDLGGSLRIPAACTGIFALRPSYGRFPAGGFRGGLQGQETVEPVIGPLARSLNDIEAFSKAVVSTQPWRSDPKSLPIPWREPADLLPPAALKIGVLWHDGVVLPTPPVTRALRIVVEKLQAAGHTIINWVVGNEHACGLSILGRTFVADGGDSVRVELEQTGEPWRPELEYCADFEEMGCAELWQMHLERNAFRQRYLDKWNEHGLDALLCPTTPFSSVEHGKFRHIGYTGVFNVLDYSCVSFPSGVFVDSALDVPLAEGGESTLLSESCVAIHEGYNPDAAHGMPISLQLVARKLEEERVIAMCKVVMDDIA
ncbi:amidase [Podospora didyma]|uniref:Amidase n=1 Tax=Podospora didyma TaxID=330526 RepID=A0AAE0NXE1_9PEZI|nr:amidase [Podospora didyma]